VEIQSLVG
jgi:KDEL-tailed cysteine endopeptidase